MTTSQFEGFCEQCLHGDRQLDPAFRMNLLSTEDFLFFKQMMLDRSSRIRRGFLELNASTPCQETGSAKALASLSCPMPRDEGMHAAASDLHKQKEVALTSAMGCQESQNSTRMDPHVISSEAREGSYGAKTLLEQPMVADAGKTKSSTISGIKSSEIQLPSSGKQFFLYSKRNYVDPDTSETLPVNFDVKPEPWLSKPLASSVQPSQQPEELPQQRVECGVTMEERQQRTEYWCKQRDLLRQRGVENTKVAGSSAGPVLPRNDGACLALELARPAGPSADATPAVDVVAMRQAMTRKLRDTFKNM